MLLLVIINNANQHIILIHVKKLHLFLLDVFFIAGYLKVKNYILRKHKSTITIKCHSEMDHSEHCCVVTLSKQRITANRAICELREL